MIARLRTRGAVVAALALALVATGCGGDAVSSAPGPSASAPPGAPEGSRVPSTAPPTAIASVAPPLRTTQPAIALSNLQGQLRVADQMFEAAPTQLARRAKLVDLLTTRAQILGQPADLARALRLADEAKPAGPGDEAGTARLRASTLSAVHRFDAATSALAPLLVPGKAAPGEVVRLQAAIHAARGELGAALPLIVSVRERRPEIGILTLEGKVLGAMGRVDDAVKAFDAAEASYRNPAPFALADLHFERGLLWEEQGELGKAKDAFRAALDRLPQHAHAALHLAPLLVPAEGVALLEGLARTSEDPEVRGRLGELKDLVAKGSGKDDVAAASAAYEKVLATLPEAYADHAGWFFLGPGADPARAWTWAEKNLAVRADAGAFALALAAARASKQPDAARCALVARARAYEWPTPRLREELAASRCE